MRSIVSSSRWPLSRKIAVGLVAVLLLCSAPGPAGSRPLETDERTLLFYHTHTDERMTATWFRDGDYVPQELERLNRFLRDYRTGDQTEMDPRLFDLLFAIRASLGGQGTFEVISAYRSPETNRMLRERSTGVARNSQHLRGTAIDVRLTGVELDQLLDAALAMERGGVGHYPRSDFVHVDTGRVRRWGG